MSDLLELRFCLRVKAKKLLYGWTGTEWLTYVNNEAVLYETESSFLWSGGHKEREVGP